jgi:MoaA/NifB/PqqE/SkfB family radical SAM enzyme
LGLSKITFTGEPLLVKWIYEALDYATNLGMYTTLMTNGALLDVSTISVLRPILNRLSLPLDGSTEEMNLRMTRLSGHFDRVSRIADGLASTPIRLKITTVVTSVNWWDVPSIGERVRQIGAAEWKLFQFRPNRGDAVIYARSFEIRDKVFDWVVSQAREALKHKGIKISSLSLRDRYTDFFLLRPNGLLELASGDAYFRLGNVLTSSFEAITGRYQEVLDRIAKANVGCDEAPPWLTDKLNPRARMGLHIVVGRQRATTTSGPHIRFVSQSGSLPLLLTSKV